MEKRGERENSEERWEGKEGVRRRGDKGEEITRKIGEGEEENG